MGYHERRLGGPLLARQQQPAQNGPAVHSTTTHHISLSYVMTRPERTVHMMNERIGYLQEPLARN